jgi:triacylglycerol lipase
MTTVSTRHLVDPEVAAILDAFEPHRFSAGSLPALRERLGQPVPGAPDPASLFPAVTRAAHAIPGLDGDPDVPVFLYSHHDTPPAAPLLLWIHGGGFIIGSAQMDDFLCRRVTAETGATVASVDYRLAPETPAPGSVHDCYAVLKWAHDNAEDLGVDPARVAIGGASAGGGLAACLAILARDRGEYPVSFQLLIYPMLDDRTGSTTQPSPFAVEFIWTPADNRFGWQSLLGREPGGEKTSPYASAARVESVAGLPPAFISAGSLDLFAAEDLQYAARLLHAGIPTELHIYPGGYHGYDMNPGARITAAHYRNMLGALTRHFSG